jgi:flavorubredoxin
VNLTTNSDADCHATSLVDAELYALGSMVALDGRISWVPAGARGYQPVNCYLLRGSEKSVLVDSGIPLHYPLIAAQLRELVGNEQFVMYLTRMEMDCVGNVSRVSEEFNCAAVYTGGTYNPFDGFDQITSRSRGSHGEPVVRLLPGESLDLGSGRRLEVLRPPLRMLTSYWAYDSGTRTLFTSDAFGYGAAPAGEYDVIRRADRDDSDFDSVAAAIQAKYWWLPVVDRSSIIEGLDRVFAEYPIERLAATHGFVLNGGDLVEKHYQLLRAVLTKGQ